jgi:SPP1 gp7 family putative phage head morphogenesis protein
MTLPLPNPAPSDPLVIQVLRDYRALMDGMDDAIVGEMARKWLEIERKLDADIVALAYEFERRQKAGEVITQQMVWKAERYQILKGRLSDEIRKYNRDYALDRITTAQEQLATLGINAANDAILASYPGAGALATSWNRINVNAVQNLIGFARDGTPLSKLLKNDYGEAANGILDALINGLARGLGPAQIARDMSAGMGLGLERALLIARTEAARAYRTGSVEQYRQSGVVSGFRRLVKKATACAACLMLDGEFFTLAEELDDHPRGKCTAVPVVDGVSPPQWQTGKEWFALQPESEQRRILGPQKYDLWKESGFPLERFAQHTENNEWGKSPRVATVKELTK